LLLVLICVYSTTGCSADSAGDKQAQGTTYTHAAGFQVLVPSGFSIAGRTKHHLHFQNGESYYLFLDAKSVDAAPDATPTEHFLLLLWQSANQTVLEHFLEAGRISDLGDLVLYECDCDGYVWKFEFESDELRDGVGLIAVRPEAPISASIVVLAPTLKDASRVLQTVNQSIDLRSAQMSLARDRE
jgi:hypothetical protein